MAASLPSLQQLPPELLLTITPYLKCSSLNALRMTCRYFRAAIVAIPRDELCPVCEYDFETLIRRDRYREACDKEASGALSDEYLVCSGCFKPHLRGYFSNTQAQLPPTERVCYGLQGKLIACKHIQFRLRDLRRLCYDKINRPKIEHVQTRLEKLCEICKPWARHGSREDTFATQPAPNVMEVRIMPSRVILDNDPQAHHDPWSGSIEVTLNLHLGYLKIGETMTEKSLYDVLQSGRSSAPTRICPHTRLGDLCAPRNPNGTSLRHVNDITAVAGSSLHSGGAKSSRSHSSPNKPTSKAEAAVFACAPLDFAVRPQNEEYYWTPLYSGECGQFNCYTSVKIERLRSFSKFGYDELQARITRNLGNLKNANDPRWLRQVIFPRGKEEQ
ncbi:MAG: hypothetical protein M1820_009045 [Bogoriella megaspora]|nr:MAG: hypothetical protein M1820_009045 [Bogoriella megaspora]